MSSYIQAEDFGLTNASLSVFAVFVARAASTMVIAHGVDASAMVADPKDHAGVVFAFIDV